MLIISVFFISTGNAQNFSTQFLTSAGKKEMSVVTINSSMIESLKKNEKNNDLLAFLNELDFLRIISIDDAKNAATCYSNAVSSLKKSENYEELLSIEENGQKVIIAALGKLDKYKTKEIVLLSYQENRLTIVNITGNITISELGKLAESIKKSIKKI
jgi:hypothetical protein